MSVVLVMMVGVSDYNALVAAAAYAVGPRVEGQEAAWERRVREVTVDLAFIAREAAQELKLLDETHPFSAFLEKVEIEPDSRRGLLTLRPPGRQEPEEIRTEQENTERGKAMIARARQLEGRWVLVYRYNEETAASKQKRGQFRNVRMVARLMDLGEGTLAFEIAKELVSRDARGDERLAARLWREAGLPLEGTVPVADLEPVRRQIREAAGTA